MVGPFSERRENSSERIVFSESISAPLVWKKLNSISYWITCHKFLMKSCPCFSVWNFIIFYNGRKFEIFFNKTELEVEYTVLKYLRTCHINL